MTGTRALVSTLMLLAGVVAGLRTARADVTIEALGQVKAGADDAEKTHRRALDDAFRQAVDRVIGTLVTPETRAAQADPIKKRVLRRARAYVVSHRVLDQGEDGGMYQLHLEVVVADVSLRQDLRALAIPIIGDLPGPKVVPDGPGGGIAPGRPKLAILVVGGAEVLPLVERLTRELGSRGFEIAIGERAEVPRDDAAALAFGYPKGARVSVVASAELQGGGPIRGTSLRGRQVDLLVRVVDGTGATPTRLLETRLAAAGVGVGQPAADAAVWLDAASRAASAVGPLLADRWPAAPRDAGGLVVWVRRVERWQEPAAVAAAVARLPGVERVTVIGAARGEVRFVVVGGASAAAVASAVPGALGTASMAARGTVQIELRAAAAAAIWRPGRPRGPKVRRLAGWPLGLTLAAAAPTLLAACPRPGQVAPARAQAALLLVRCEVFDATIWIDERPIAQVRDAGGGLRLLPGAYHLEIRHDRYHTRYFELRLGRGETRTLEVSLAEVLD